MKNIFLLLVSLITMSNAFGADSDWKICKGEATLFGRSAKLVANIYEHRNGEGRQADLTLIYGGNILRGALNTSDNTNGVVSLKEGRSSYKGNVSVDYAQSSFSLNGKLVLANTATNVIATLECETL